MKASYCPDPSVAMRPYEQGRLIRQELDINHDGKADLVQYFEDGKMVRTERLLPGAEGAGSAAPEKGVSPASRTTPATVEPPPPSEKPAPSAPSAGDQSPPVKS